MITKVIYSMTLSLAGICQSACLVEQLAKKGTCNNNYFQVCLESILETNPTSVMHIYGNDEKNLQLGLKKLVSILHISNFLRLDIPLIKHIFNMMTIEKKLRNNKNSIYKLRKNILKMNLIYTKEDKNIDILTTKCADLYLKVISSLGSRIKIQGIRVILKNSIVQEKIRCILLAGIRSIFLWRQFNGDLFILIFFRNDIIYAANHILQNIKNNV